MLHHYKTTPLEQWVEALYGRLGIHTPEQLHIAELAAKLNIWVYGMDMGSMAIERNGSFSINIDRRLSKKEQWEDFLHELCHVLRHSGNQMLMPEPYSSWQEQDAGNFQLYAAIPISFVRRISLPDRQIEAIDLLSEQFHVTHRLAATRLEQIQRRVLQGILDEEFRAANQSKTRTYSAAQWSESTRAIMDKLQRQLERKGEQPHGEANRPV